MVTPKRRVLVTGASGYIAAQLLPEFRERYDLTLVDVTDTDRAGNQVDGIVIADLADADRSGYERLFRGVDAVVHLGYRRSSPGGVFGEAIPHIDRFDTEFANVRMANNVYRAAYDAGVRRLVVASSNHAADWYEHALIHRQQKEVVSPNEVPWSDNFYGWAKAAYELLAWPYASGNFGRQLEFVHVRIGAPRELDATTYEAQEEARRPAGSGLANYKRDLGAYLSPRDLRQLVARGIDTEDIRDEHGVPWVVVYGISGNTRAFWSLESARRVLGYEPQDDAEVRLADDVHRLLTGPDSDVSGGRVGA